MDNRRMLLGRCIRCIVSRSTNLAVRDVNVSENYTRSLILVSGLLVGETGVGQVRNVVLAFQLSFAER